MQTKETAVDCGVATLSLRSEDGEQNNGTVSLRKVLACVSVGEVTARALVRAPKFGMTFSDGIICSVCREN